LGSHECHYDCGRRQPLLLERRAQRRARGRKRTSTSPAAACRRTALPGIRERVKRHAEAPRPGERSRPDRGRSVRSPMPQDIPHGRRQVHAAHLAGVVIHADAREARHGMVGRTFQVGAPVATEGCCSRRGQFGVSRDGLKPSDDYATALLTGAVGRLLRGRHDPNRMPPPPRTHAPQHERALIAAGRDVRSREPIPLAPYRSPRKSHGTLRWIRRKTPIQ
jgi:hypothetical protein